MLKLILDQLKITVRNRGFLIWGILFPFAYITIYYFALGNLVKDDFRDFRPVKVGLLVESQEDENLIDLLEEIDLIRLEVTTADPQVLEEKLKDESLEAMIYPYTEVAEKTESSAIDHLFGMDFSGRQWAFRLGYNNSYRASLLRGILQPVNSQSALKKSIYQGLSQGSLDAAKAPFTGLLSASSGKSEQDFSLQPYDKLEIKAEHKGVSPFHQIFYAAIAYLAIMPFSAGLDASRQIEANQSGIAQRRLVSSQSKFTMLFADLVPLLVIQLFITTAAYVYTCRLGIEYPPFPLESLGLLWLGSILAILAGACLGVLTSHKPGLGQALAIGLPLFLGFTSGMMGLNESVLVKAIPVLGVLQKINPVHLIAKGFYVLQVDGPADRYLSILMRMSLLLGATIVLTLVLLRRNSYENL